MTQKKFKEKYNESCVKIFKLLQLLYSDNATYSEVNKIFSDSDTENQCVMINKYLNTLKVFGLKLRKTNNKYSMQNTIFKSNFSLEDLRAIRLLENLSEQFPQGKIKSDITGIVSSIKMHFDDTNHLQYNKISANTNEINSFLYSNIRDQIETCENYCRENYNLKLKYLYNEENVEILCVAKQVIYDNKLAYFRVYKPSRQEIIDVPINNILEIDVLPSQKINYEIPTTITYKIKSDLAKSYTLKNTERLSRTCEDGSIIIANQGEPFDSLIKRLIRYDNKCVILHPKFLRDKMIQVIDDTLKNYE